MIEQMERDMKPIITQAFRISDGNGGHIPDKKGIKETIISGLIVSILTGVVVAAILGTFSWAKDDRKQILADLGSIKTAVEKNSVDINKNMEIAFILNDMQSDAINRNTLQMAKKWNWIPCPPALPKTSDLIKSNFERSKNGLPPVR